MRIYHNIPALNAWRNMGVNQSQLSKSLERLSSGLRINRAADDAAGLTISEKMRGQISGLTMAAKNAQDGISLIQTAEGALNETHSILQRMRELAVEAANDTLTSQDRQEIQKEIDQLIDEIDRIGNTTEFNTKKLLNGALSQTLSDDSDFFDAVEATSDTKDGVYRVSFNSVARRGIIRDGARFSGLSGLGSSVQLQVQINGQVIEFASNDDLNQIVAKINVASDKTRVQAYVGGRGGLALRTLDYGADAQVTISGNANLLQRLGLQGADGVVTNLTDSGEDAVGNIDERAAVGDGVYLKLVDETSNANGLKVQELITETAAQISNFEIAQGGTFNNNELIVNGRVITLTASTTATAIASLINGNESFGVIASAVDSTHLNFTSRINGLEAEVAVTQRTVVDHTFGAWNNAGATVAVKINGVSITVSSNIDSAASFATLLNSYSSQTGLHATVESGAIRLIGLNPDSTIRMEKLGTSGFWGAAATISVEGTIYLGNASVVFAHGSINGINSTFTNAVVTFAQAYGSTVVVTFTGVFSSVDNATAIWLNGVKISAGASATIGSVVAAINAHVSTTGVHASYDSSNHLVLNTVRSGQRIVFGSGGASAISSWFGLGANDDHAVIAEPTVSAGTITINGVNITITTNMAIDDFISAINSHVATTGVIASRVDATQYYTGRIVFRTVEKGLNAEINITNTIANTGITTGKWVGTEEASGPTGNVTVDNDNTLQFHIGANRDQTMRMAINDMRSTAIGKDVTGNQFKNVQDLKGVGVTTREYAENAIELIDKAIQDVSSERAKLGAYQNRLEHTIANLNVSAENMTASESRIRDVDMAREMMKFTKYQILNQSSTAMLAQANTLPQGVLSLLR